MDLKNISSEEYVKYIEAVKNSSFMDSTLPLIVESVLPLQIFLTTSMRYGVVWRNNGKLIKMYFSSEKEAIFFLRFLSFDKPDFQEKLNSRNDIVIW